NVYESLGGVEGALAKHAEDAFVRLPPITQSALGPVLKALVTVGRDGVDSNTDVSGGHVVRRRASLVEIESIPQARPLLHAFVKERLLVSTSDEATRQRTVTLAHESLMRVWPRAVEWARQNRDFLVTRARVFTRMKEGSLLLD